MGLGDVSVSFAVRLIDARTGRTADGYARVSEGRPIIKPDGFRVFTNIQRKNIEIAVGGKGFFDDVVLIDEKDDVWDSRLKALQVYLIPCKGYALSPGDFYINIHLDAGIRQGKLMAVPKTKAASLSRLEAGAICINGPVHAGFENRHFAFIKNGILDCFIIGKRLEGNRYGLASPPRDSYEAGEKLYAVCLARTDASGGLFCPLFEVKGGEAGLYTMAGEHITDAVAIQTGGAYPWAF